MGFTVGLTSTIPVEIVFAAGCRPLDLNNVFITSGAPEKLIQQAEQAGFAHNVCAWMSARSKFQLLSRKRSLVVSPCFAGFIPVTSVAWDG